MHVHRPTYHSNFSSYIDCSYWLIIHDECTKMSTMFHFKYCFEQDTCELTIDPTSSNSYVDDGWYVGAIILEDFPRSTITLGGQTYTETDPMSAVPLAVSEPYATHSHLLRVFISAKLYIQVFEFCGCRRCLDADI